MRGARSGCFAKRWTCEIHLKAPMNEPSLSETMRAHDQEDADRRARAWGPKDWARAIGAFLACLGALAALITALTALSQADATRVLVEYRVVQLEAVTAAAKAEDTKRDEKAAAAAAAAKAEDTKRDGEFYALVTRVEVLVARVDSAVRSIERWSHASGGGVGPTAPPAPQPPAPRPSGAPKEDSLDERLQQLTRRLDQIERNQREQAGEKPDEEERR